VAASIGSYGAYLADGSEYRGEYSLDMQQLMDFHRPRMTILANSGADFLAFETIPCLLEAKALLELLKEFPASQAWLSFSCKNQTQNSQGEDFGLCAELANSSHQIIAFGVNCVPPENVLKLLETAKKATEKPLLAYPNSGERWDSSSKSWLADVTCMLIYPKA